MSEIIIYRKEDLLDWAKGSTKHMGKVTLPSGRYRVTRLEKREQEIQGEKRKWIDVHLSGKDKSGVVSATRFASAGFEEKPVKGRLKGTYYFPSKPIEACFEGDLADLLVEIQGKDVEIVAVEGSVPSFPLKSFATEKEALDMAKKESAFSKKQFMRITKIFQPTA